jgi:hypothetical protein
VECSKRIQKVKKFKESSKSRVRSLFRAPHKKYSSQQKKQIPSEKKKKKAYLEAAVLVKDLNAVRVGVGHDYVVAGVDGDAAGLGELAVVDAELAELAVVDHLGASELRAGGGADGQIGAAVDVAGVVKAVKVVEGSMRLTHKKTVISHKLCTHF